MGMADSLFGAIPGVRRWWWRRKWSSLDVPANEWATLDGMVEDLGESLTNVRSLETLLENAAMLRAGHGMNTRTVYQDPAGKEHAVEIILDGTTATEKLIEGYQREMDTRRREMMKLAVEMSNWAAKNAVAMAYENRPPLPERIAAFVRDAARIARELNKTREGRTADEFFRHALLDRESRAKRLEAGQKPERVRLEKAEPEKKAVTPPPKKRRIADKDEKRRREMVRIIPAAFADFGVAARFTEFISGHTITRYKLKLERSQKLSKVKGLEDEVAMRLGVANVSIVRSETESQTVYVDIPNETVTPLYFHDAPQEEGKLIIGVDIEGKPVFSDMDELCHLLIAGKTGSGKSVFLNALICSLIREGPEKNQLVMIDPKAVELKPYEDIPHLWQPVITDSTEAIVALGKAADEMENRYRQFPKGVRNLAEYNQSAETPMPRLIVVIDELSDLMMTSGKLAETSIARIAQKGRAAGIHLVVATQSPRADIITGKIKANLSSRIAFAAASAIESHIILDEAGAEKLVGKGDMLFRLQNEKPRRLQGYYISPEEIGQAVADLKTK